MLETLVKKTDKLMFIPIALFLIALASLAMMQMQTGSYVERGIDLMGGRLITIEFSGEVDQTALENQLKSLYGDVSVKMAESVGSKVLLIQTGVDTDPEQVITTVGETVNVLDSSNQETGAALGEAFWEQTQVALLFSFLLMATVIFLLFRRLIPSVTVIFNALSDLVLTLAVMNFLGIKLSLAGLGGILMLIGYSTDTNVLLMTRVTKSLEEPFESRVTSSIKTGLVMTATTLAALFSLYFVSTSPVLSEIALILIIGLMIDTMNTWIVNVGLIKRFMGGLQ